MCNTLTEGNPENSRSVTDTVEGMIRIVPTQDSSEVERCATTGAMEFYCLDEFSLDETANAVMLIGSGICDAVDVFPS